MLSFEKLDDYLQNDYDEVSRKVSTECNIFLKYPELASQISNFQKIIGEHKQELFRFIQNSISVHEQSLKGFFQSFNITTRPDAVKEFIKKEQTIQHLFGKISMHASCLGQKQQPLEAKITHTRKLLDDILQFTRWLEKAFQ